MILEVPFTPQMQDNDCGPAALVAVLASRGHHSTLEEISAAVINPVLNRTLLPDMENYARERGFSPITGRGDSDFLKQRIDAGVPVILLLDLGRMGASQGHYVVVVGHALGGFVVHAGTAANRFVPQEWLEQRWRRMNNLYLYLE